MDVPTIEIVLAALGIVATFLVWAFDRFMPGRKRIGYRVQMDTPIAMNPQDAHSLVQLRLFREDQEITDATLALLRIENDGSKDIVRQDYQEPLVVDFAGRTVIGVEVPDANPASLVGMLTRNHGLRLDGSRLAIPKVPLNKRNHFKLLVLLTGTGGEVTMDGFLSGGRIRRNEQRRGPRKLYLGLGAFLITLLGALGGVWLNGPEVPQSSECASGKLVIDGSTAFAPLTAQISRAYEAQCPDAEITVTDNGSLTGIRDLESAGQKGAGVAPARVAVSDGPAPKHYGQLEGQPVGVVIFSVVVNKATGIHDLSAAQLRDIYAGKHTNWHELGGNDVPISLVSRSSDSGTRKTFEKQVLHASEPAFSSDDCTSKDRNRKAPVIRCELGSTTQLLEAVNRVPGAIGYTEMSAATKYPHVERIQLGGRAADIEPVKQKAYPYWTVEYFYTYRQPADGTLTAKFLTFLNSDTARNIMRTYGHVPCNDRENLTGTLCRP